jgi:hypothetical protein
VEDEMPASVHDLVGVEERLDRTFTLAVVAFLVVVFWPLAARVTGVNRLSRAPAAGLVLLALLLGAYVWFAHAAMVAAGRVGRSKALVATWVVLAPFLDALVTVPILSQAILASPLVLKFVLAAELRALIREKTFD